MSLEYRPVKEGHAVAAWVKALKGKSGVYLIREKNGFLFFAGDVVYCGESHSGRLNTTLLRHFQHWIGKTAGPTFAVSKFEVAVVCCPAARALDLQNAMIAEYRPKLNTAANPDAETNERSKNRM
jgi:excinuclease UvrABC nuclease subunit